MSVTVIHPSLNRSGGAEKMCLEAIAALNESGYSVALYTLDEPRWPLIEANWGDVERPDSEYFIQEGALTPSDLGGWVRCSALYLWLLYYAQTEDSLTFNNYGEVYPFISDISYIHSQPLASVDGNPYRVPLWEITGEAYRRLQDKLLERRLSPVLVTNSTYNARHIQKVLGSEPTVLHPPIDAILYRFEPKNGRVLTVCRLTPEKNLRVINEVLRHIRGVRFSVAGGTTPQSSGVMSTLRSRYVDLYPNPRRDEIIGLMKESSVYLSTQPNEAFGIAVLEAMSAGCVPVVYRNGGPWHDILGAEDGEAGYGYTTGREAAEHIADLLSDDGKRERLRMNSVRRSRYFTTKRFREGLLGIIEGAEHAKIQGGRLLDAYHTMSRLRDRFDRLWRGRS
jgi:glycosyltransferase involved in cell wall biosynthesis